jgi:hypothetical protein
LQQRVGREASIHRLRNELSQSQRRLVEGESRAEQSVESMARQHARQLERSATTQRDRRRTYDTTTSNKTHNITARFTATGKQSQTKSQTINAQRVESSHRIAITTKSSSSPSSQPAPKAKARASSRVGTRQETQNQKKQQKHPERQEAKAGRCQKNQWGNWRHRKLESRKFVNNQKTQQIKVALTISRKKSMNKCIRIG